MSISEESQDIIHDIKRPDPVIRVSLEDSLRDTIAKADLESVVTEFSELLVDKLIDGEFLSELPIISSLKGFLKTGSAIRDRLFIKKLVTFLSEIQSIDPRVRNEFVQKLESSPEFLDRVGDHYIMLLGRMDSMIKPELLGKAFKACCKQQIAVSELQYLGYAIDKLNIGDISLIKRFRWENDYDNYGEPENKKLSEAIPSEQLQGCLNAGFGYIGSGAFIAGLIFPNDICKKFVEYVLPE